MLINTSQLKLMFGLLILAPDNTVAATNTLTGGVVGVTDGDTITVLDAGNTEHKIRLAGIDAPEQRQPYGAKAKRALSSKVFRKNVEITHSSKDRYGRIVGDVYFGARWINMELVAEGLAWHYKRYSSDKVLAAAEIQARETRVGLWKDGSSSVPPWEFRLKARRRSSPRPTLSQCLSEK